MIMVNAERSMGNRDIRGHRRLELDFEVEYSVLSGINSLKLIQARTLDFSLSGTRIDTEQQLIAGDQLSVRIVVPDLNSFTLDDNGGKRYKKTAVMCFGAVRWVKPSGDSNYNAGIRFARLPVSDVSYLRRLLAKESIELRNKPSPGE